MATVPIYDILVDDTTWAAGTDARRQEWRLAIDEVLLEGRFSPEGAPPKRLLLALGPSAIDVEAFADQGRRATRHELPFDQLRPLVTEYVETCIEMGKLSVGDNSPRLEALDIAKRITHDEAGELVMSLLRGLNPDHATARRLFTLAVTLLYDTTRLALAHPPRLVL